MDPRVTRFSRYAPDAISERHGSPRADAARANIYLVTDDPTTRLSLASLLANAGAPSTRYDGPSAFIEEAVGLAPGCVVVDLSASCLDGFEFVQSLRDRSIAFPAVIIAGDSTVRQVVDAMKAGVIDVIEKPHADEAVLSAVRSALTVAGRLAARKGQVTALARLTPREHDVLNGVLSGKTNKWMARECGISPRTVEIHRANLMKKSGARSVSELVRLALAGDLAGADPGAQGFASTFT